MMSTLELMPLSSWAGAFLLGALAGGKTWGPTGAGLGGVLAMAVPLAMVRVLSTRSTTTRRIAGQ
jgi:hypothetical protein